jgi:hypothetical protein
VQCTLEVLEGEAAQNRRQREVELGGARRLATFQALQLAQTAPEALAEAGLRVTEYQACLGDMPGRGNA